MENRDIDIDIEAHIRDAKRLRSEALNEILGSAWAVAWKKCVRAFRRLANRRLHAHIVAARSQASTIY